MVKLIEKNIENILRQNKYLHSNIEEYRMLKLKEYVDLMIEDVGASMVIQALINLKIQFILREIDYGIQDYNQKEFTFHIFGKKLTIQFKEKYYHRIMYIIFYFGKDHQNNIEYYYQDEILEEVEDPRSRIADSIKYQVTEIIHKELMGIQI